MNDVAPFSALGDGIFQLRLPMAGNPLRYVNGYLLEESDGLTLVDCGWRTDEVLAFLRAAIAATGHDLADVRRLAVTHQHFDHYGLAGTLLRNGVDELLMHARDWERAIELIRDHDRSEALAVAWLTRHGYPAEAERGPGERTELTPPTRTVADGERIGRLVAIWTPGHTVGHLCFHDTRSGRTLTGDHVLDPITPHVGTWRDRADDPLGDYIASLHKVKRWAGGGALPGHGEPFADLGRRVDEILAHTAAREAKIVALLVPGPISATAVARALPWTRRERTFAELGGWHQEFAVSETLAHLEHLRFRGAVERDERAPDIVYRQT